MQTAIITTAASAARKRKDTFGELTQLTKCGTCGGGAWAAVWVHQLPRRALGHGFETVCIGCVQMRLWPIDGDWWVVWWIEGIVGFGCSNSRRRMVQEAVVWERWRVAPINTAISGTPSWGRPTLCPKALIIRLSCISDFFLHPSRKPVLWRFEKILFLSFWENSWYLRQLLPRTVHGFAEMFSALPNNVQATSRNRSVTWQEVLRDLL